MNAVTGRAGSQLIKLISPAELWNQTGGNGTALQFTPFPVIQPSIHSYATLGWMRERACSQALWIRLGSSAESGEMKKTWQRNGNRCRGWIPKTEMLKNTKMIYIWKKLHHSLDREHRKTKGFNNVWNEGTSARIPKLGLKPALLLGLITTL